MSIGYFFNANRKVYSMIPVWSFQLTDKEKELVMDSLESGWISSSGPYVAKFEEKMAEYIGVKHGIAVSSGTAALETAVHALGLKPGDEIITPDFTIISNVVAAIRQHLHPVFIDSNKQNWNMDISQIEQLITPKTKALMVVHIYGLPVDMPEIMRIAAQYNLLVIEDCAEAIGAELDGKRVGSFGDAAVFSFFANKSITTAEGGMVVTNNSLIAERANGFKNLYFGEGKEKFIHSHIGCNYRMSSLHAALGYGQMLRIDSIIEKQREIGRYYTNRFRDMKHISLPYTDAMFNNVYWVYGIVLQPECGMTALELIEILRTKGIESRPFFTGMHAQPFLQKDTQKSEPEYPVSDYLSKYGLYLPSGAGLTREHQEYVAETLLSIFS